MNIDHEAREQLREIMEGLRHNAANPPQQPEKAAMQFGYFSERLWALLEKSKSSNPTSI